MGDQHWRTLHEIASWVGGSETGISARLRDLRKDGYTVNRRRVTGANGLWEYSAQTIHQFKFDSNGQGAFL